MSNEICAVKKKLDEAITQLCKVYWMFSKNPERDFSGDRKLSFHTTISFLLSMEGGNLTTELMNRFGYSSNIPSSSALVQRRAKIDPAAFSSLFDLFVQKT